MQVEEPKLGRSGVSLPRGFFGLQVPASSKANSSPGVSNLPQDSYICVPTSRWATTVIFICAISMIRGDVGRGNEAGEVLKRKILTAPAPCLRLAHRCRATFCAAGQTGPAGRDSISCMYAQACVPVQSSYPHQLCMKYTLQHHSVIHVVRCAGSEAMPRRD
mgnify:CR=1 FL=1